MSANEQDYLAGLRRHASETRRLFSNSQKAERERMVVRAFLRCIGESFSEAEILIGNDEPVDVAFRSANFQIRDFVGGKKRGDDWRDREARWNADDVVETWTDSEQMSFDEVSNVIASSLADKRYGPSAATIDAIAYVDLGARHLWPLDSSPKPETIDELKRQGWRSVSMLFPPYGAVLFAQPTAPTFLGKRKGLILSEWPGVGDWFDV